MAFTSQDVTNLQKYLQKKFDNDSLTLKMRKTGDSVEVLLNGEFIAVIYKDEEDRNDVSYDLNMSILAIDLEDA